MIITSNILNKMHAPESLVEILQENYSGAATIEEISQNPNLEEEDIFFIINNFRLNGDMHQYFLDKCKIEYSNNVINSMNVKNSNNIAASNSIINSNYIYDSKNIEDSRAIVTSNSVNSSENIYDSNNIYNSYKVIESNKVFNSNNINNCNNVEWSKYLIYSADIDNSSFLYKCNSCNSCDFSGFLENCNNCLLCYNLSGKENYLFNEPSTPEEIFKWSEILKMSVNDSNMSMIKIHENLYDEFRFEYTHRFDSIFNGLNETFYDLIKTVPNYSSDKILFLFFYNILKKI